MQHRAGILLDYPKTRRRGDVMKSEQPTSPLTSQLFPTAGYGSVAPTWIKADLQQTPAPKQGPLLQHNMWYWLRRQLSFNNQ